MPRLRTATFISVLMLAGGIAGTAWLSDQTAGWQGPKARYAQPAVRPTHVASSLRREHPRIAPMRAVRGPDIAAVAAAAPPPLSLTPVDMPWPDASVFSRRVARDGRALLDLDIDGTGHVVSARIAESSGDGVVDAEALAVVKGWRFAVPDGHPDGVSGQLVWTTRR